MTFKTMITAALLLGLLAAPAACADPYRRLCEEIARAAADNSVKRVAVQSFESRSGAGRNEGAYAAEQVSVSLSATKKVSLIERSLLEGVLKEAGLSSAAGGREASREIFSVDAVVTGVVFPDGDSLKVFVKLIELHTGRVLLSKAAETLRLSGSFMETMSEAMGLPDVPMPEARDMDIFARPPADLRDTPAERETGICSRRRAVLAKMNEELVDDKALYWAARMLAPGFSLAELRRNPGSEIADPELRRYFYAVLGRYYAEGRAAGPAEGTKERLGRLMHLEEKTAEKCGAL